MNCGWEGTEFCPAMPRTRHAVHPSLTSCSDDRLRFTITGNVSCTLCDTSLDVANCAFTSYPIEDFPSSSAAAMADQPTVAHAKREGRYWSL